VSYRDSAGRTIVFRDSVGSNPPLYHVGEGVIVLAAVGVAALRGQTATVGVAA